MEHAQNAAQRQQMMNNLKQLGLAYHNCHDTNMRGPQNWQEAAQFGLPADAQAALEGAGYTVHWGIKMQDATGGSSNFILAYPTNAASEGGSVLMLDGAVMHLSAQDFNDTLAKQKVDSPTAMAAATGGVANGGESAQPGGAPADGSSPPGPPTP